MMIISQWSTGNHFCPDCNFTFGALPTATGEIACPLCRKKLYSPMAGVTQIDHIHFRCNQCGLLFGYLRVGQEVVYCIMCGLNPQEKGRVVPCFSDT